MKTFRIGIWEETGGYVEIKAKTAEQAKAKVIGILDEHGMAGFRNLDVTHRQCEIVDCEEA